MHDLVFYYSGSFRCGRNFFRPTVYCFLKVGNAPLSSYRHSEPAFCKALFMASTACFQVTLVPSTFVASVLLLL